MENFDTRIAIVGAGMAGLSAGLRLKQLGIDDFVILEKGGHVGGRIRTDSVDGFLIDRGFQIYLPAYPSARAFLDYEALDFQYFEKGALIAKNGRHLPFSGPELGAWELLKSGLFGPGTTLDKFRLLKLMNRLAGQDAGAFFEETGTSSRDWLEASGFSPKMLREFWEPFYQGVFLENDLATSAAMLKFTFKWFAQAGGAIPARGMQAIPRQLADLLGLDRIRFDWPVETLAEKSLAGPRGKVSADCIILASDANHQDQLLQRPQSHSFFDVTHFSFIAESLILKSRKILVNANRQRRINNVAYLSLVAPTYAPSGKNLISVSANGVGHKVGEIRAELQGIVGKEAEDWELLQVNEIAHALPDQSVVRWDYSPQIADGVFICGDHCLYGATDGAVRSGILAANAVWEKMKP